MNATDETEACAYDAAFESAEYTIYEQLKGMFGVHGENLAFYLAKPTPPTRAEAYELMIDLRNAYTKRAQTEANRMMEG